MLVVGEGSASCRGRLVLVVGEGSASCTGRLF